MLAFVVHYSPYTIGVPKAAAQYGNGLDQGDEFDEHNMKTAELVARKSPDQNTKVRTGTRNQILYRL